MLRLWTSKPSLLPFAAFTLQNGCRRHALIELTHRKHTGSSTGLLSSRSFSSSRQRYAQFNEFANLSSLETTHFNSARSLSRKSNRLDSIKASNKISRIEASSSDDAANRNNSDDQAAGTPPSDSASSPPSSSSSAVAKLSVPDVYPQVLALPIARRPLFPGFYKAVVIKNPAVVEAVKEMLKRGQPYLGAFLLKDESSDSDVITSLDSVYPVGVFAQVTSVFAASNKDEDGTESLTAVLYPHRRIKITDLVRTPDSTESTFAQVVDANSDPQQDVGPLTPPESPEKEISIEEASKTELSLSREHFQASSSCSYLQFSFISNCFPSRLCSISGKRRKYPLEAVQQGRSTYPSIHVRDYRGVQGHRTTQSSVP